MKLNSGLEYRGVLASLDGYLNIAMEQTEEYDNGQLKSKYGDAFIRGNNGKWNSLADLCEVHIAFSFNFLTLRLYLFATNQKVLYISTQPKKR